MIAFVYKSLKKPDTYLYLREKDAFGLVPESVRAPLGALAFVLQIERVGAAKLAHADAAIVRANLIERGFHLQLPAKALDPLVAGGVGDG